MLRAVFVLLLASIASADDGSWRQYGGEKRDFVAKAIPEGGTTRLWRRELGPGTSGIVSDGKLLFTMYSVPDAKEQAKGEEWVVALDAKTGETKWSHHTPVARLKGQQTFSGEPIRPQATPALLGDRLCTLGHTGLLHCFDANSGKVLWEYDLVKQFAAKPVQFGFSASPLVYGKQFIVHVGGTATCLLALDAESGKVIWKAKAAEPSYASPVLLPGEKGDVIVQVTRDELLGLSAKDGSLLWSYPLPDAGLTNVPTPLVLSERRLLISGQGARGTRLLQVVSDKDKTEVKELWKNQKARLFYCNALKDEEAVYGSVGEFLVALRLSDGSELWRERGQADANLLQVGSEVLILRGDGRLTRSRLSPKGLEASDPEELLKSRTWTAPTLIDNTLYARSEKEITAVRFMGREKK